MSLSFFTEEHIFTIKEERTILKIQVSKLLRIDKGEQIISGKIRPRIPDVLSSLLIAAQSLLTRLSQMNCEGHSE